MLSTCRYNLRTSLKSSLIMAVRKSFPIDISVCLESPGQFFGPKNSPTKHVCQRAAAKESSLIKYPLRSACLILSNHLIKSIGDVPDSSLNLVDIRVEA